MQFPVSSARKTQSALFLAVLLRFCLVFIVLFVIFFGRERCERGGAFLRTVLAQCVAIGEAQRILGLIAGRDLLVAAVVLAFLALGFTARMVAGAIRVIRLYIPWHLDARGNAARQADDYRQYPQRRYPFHCALFLSVGNFAA